MVSNYFRDESRKAYTDDVTCVLLTFTHPDLKNPIRVTGNNQQVVSNGKTYTPFPMEIRPPKDTADQPHTAEVILSNIDQLFIDTLHSVREGIECQIAVVMYSTPNVEEISFTLKASNMFVTKENITIQLQDSRDTDEIFIKAFGRSDLESI